jgi:hypothetical protein
VSAVQAIKDRDRDALMASFNSLEEAEAFRSETLPSMSPADCKWFWQQVMSPEQLERTVDAVRDVCLRVARELELTPNVHYSLGNSEGLPTMVVSAAVAPVFYARLETGRHSVLRFYLQVAV